MKVQKNSVAVVQIKMWDDKGQMLDQTDTPLPILVGGLNGLPEKMEELLVGKTIGESVTATLEADDAFGPVDPDLRFRDALEHFPEDVAPGMELEGESEDGEVMFLRVVAVTDTEVELDANHPFAGMTIKFEVEIVEIREATADELEHGHAHDGHVHDENCQH